MTTTASTTTDFDTTLIGQLETWPLPDVLVWLNQTRRTAMLRVGIGLSAGVIFFEDGHLYRAEWGELAGEHALLALFGLQGGSFALIQREIPCPRPNIFRQTPELLLQCAIALDEMRRASSQSDASSAPSDAV